MKTIVVLMVSVCVLASSGLAQEANEGGTAAAIRALEQEWTVGQSRHDNRALDLIFDNFLVYVEYGKLVTKGEYLSRIKSQVSEPNQLVMEPISVRLFGNTAIAIGTYVEKQGQGGRRPTQRWRFIDTWVYKKNGWVLVAAGATPISH